MSMRKLRVLNEVQYSINMIFYEFSRILKNWKIREFLWILQHKLTNSRTMGTVHLHLGLIELLKANISLYYNEKGKQLFIKLC